MGCRCTRCAPGQYRSRERRRSCECTLLLGDHLDQAARRQRQAVQVSQGDDTTGKLRELHLEDPGHLTVSIVFKDVHTRSEEHTSELQSRENLVCRLLLEK